MAAVIFISCLLNFCFNFIVKCLNFLFHRKILTEPDKEIDKKENEDVYGNA